MKEAYRQLKANENRKNDRKTVSWLRNRARTQICELWYQISYYKIIWLLYITPHQETQGVIQQLCLPVLRAQYLPDGCVWSPISLLQRCKTASWKPQFIYLFFHWWSLNLYYKYVLKSNLSKTLLYELRFLFDCCGVKITWFDYASRTGDLEKNAAKEFEWKIQCLKGC